VNLRDEVSTTLVSQRVDQTLNNWVGCSAHPLTRVVLTSCSGDIRQSQMRGFAVSQFDMALHRQFDLGERLKLQFKVEVFNLFNHPNFGNPVNILSSSSFGQSTQMLGRSLGNGGINGGLSPLYQIGGPRSIQLAVRLQF
jgi:hypothetical protein